MIPRLTVKRSTPTLLTLQESLTPLFQAIPGSAPPAIAETMSRSLLPRVAALVESAWKWSQGTTDTNGEQKVS